MPLGGRVMPGHDDGEGMTTERMAFGACHWVAGAGPAMTAEREVYGRPPR